MKVLINLVKPAKKAGGDKYESTDGALNIYVPQTISRPDGGEPIGAFTVEFTAA